MKANIPKISYFESNNQIFIQIILRFEENCEYHFESQ